ncbi:PepSY domain-containing protein [Schlegelella sp. S2-27]|uniref:PepSY domain-containing protein n=1 Tax=Caldimonas mangrovi TaxID=2944811 RepID=A0ABT0YLJ3_9BURK|nr:PepSY-associated TM helix domain-containing protein [Caldimonas mangrovi]MCM5679289.1 PepSY domain-containing protein [Caldimonas mangrovi]
MNQRSFWVLAHRYAGLAIAFFLLIAGLTGALLAFNDEIDTALNPGLRLIDERPNETPLDALVLRERVGQQVPGAHFDYHPLHRDEGRTAALYAWRMEGPATSQAPVWYEIFADPYTGAVLGMRNRGAWVFDRVHFMPLVYQLHYALTIPYPWGMWLFGVVSFVWMFDCFVGAYLTFPRRRQGFFKGWKPAWLVKWSGSAYRINFDLHRAASLWLWGMLLMYAVSSVSLNLGHELYMPVLKRLVPTVDAHDKLPDLAANPVMQANMPWEQARARGRELMAAHAHRDGFTIEHEDSLFFERDHGAWRYAVRSSHDFSSDHGATSVYFSAQDAHGEEIVFEHPTIAPGNTFTSWLAALHTGKVFGLPYRLLVVVLGVVTALLCVTGVVIWLRKRQGRRLVSAERTTAQDRPSSRNVVAEDVA